MREEGPREGGHELPCHLGEGLSRSHSELWAGLEAARVEGMTWAEWFSLVNGNSQKIIQTRATSRQHS